MGTQNRTAPGTSVSSSVKWGFQLNSCRPHFINDTADTVSKDISGDFPGGLVAETPCSQCRGAWVHSLVRELDPTCCN